MTGTNQSSSGGSGARGSNGSAATSTPRPGARTGNEANQGNQRGTGQQGNANSRSRGTGFKGASDDMKSNVFQLAHESDNVQQFAKTIEALKAVVAEKFINQVDILPIFREPYVTPVIIEPPLPEAPENQIAIKRWEKLYDHYIDRTNVLTNNSARLYTLIWGQCSKPLKEKIKASAGYQVGREGNDVVWILNKIKELCFKFEEQKYMFTSLHEAYRRFYNLEQRKDQSVQDYYAVFVNTVQAIEHFGGSFGSDPALVKLCATYLNLDMDTYLIDPEQVALTRAAARERYLAMALIAGADAERFSELRTDLHNGFMAGRNEYPIDIATAHKRLVEFKSNKKVSTNRNPRNDNRRRTGTDTGGSAARTEIPPEEGITLAQVSSGSGTPGTDGRTYDSVECYNCHAHGHYSHSCPHPQRERNDNVTLFQTVQEDITDDLVMGDLILTQIAEVTLTKLDDGFKLNKRCVLLDSQSTINVVHWSNLLTDITKVPKGIRVHTNGGYQDSNLRGTPVIFPALGDSVWYNPDSIANIFSLAHVTDHYRVTLDTAVDNAFLVHLDDHGNNVLRFHRCGKGLYCHELGSPDNTRNDTNANVNHYSFYSAAGTVDDNASKYTKDELAKATQAYDLVRNAGFINPRDLMSILNRGAIRNSTVTALDVQRAIDIFGPMTALIKGKSTRHAPSHVPLIERVPVPDFIRLHYNDVFLSADFFHINGHVFLHTISRHLRLRTCQYIQGSPSAKAALTGLQRVRETYASRGFRLIDVHADNAFSPIVEAMRPTTVNIAAAGMKAPEAERSIRVIRERVRCMTSDRPYKRITKEMCLGSVHECTRTLNLFPPKNGLSKFLSPHTIVTGIPPVDASTLVIRSGDYAQVLEHGSTDVNPKSQPRTVGAIALYQANPITNSWYFQSLSSWKKLHVDPHHWTILPIPQSVIEAVEARALHEKQPLLSNGCPIFAVGYHPSNMTDDFDDILDDDSDDDFDDDIVNTPRELSDDISFVDPNPLPPNEDYDSDEDDNLEEEDDNLEEEDDRIVTDETPATDTESNSGIESHANDNIAETDDDAPDLLPRSDESDDDESDDDTSNQGDTIDEVADDSHLESNTTATGYGLRSSRERNYDHLRHPGEANLDFTFSMLDVQLNYDGCKGTIPKAEQNQLITQMVKVIEMQERQVGTKERELLTTRQGVTTYKGPAMNKFLIDSKAVSLTQMTAKKGIAMFGERALKAIWAEFAQLHDKKVFATIDAGTLTMEQKRRALREITLIKLKRCGKVKGRCVADGRGQRRYISKEESSSPTVSSDAFFMSLLIDAFEERDVATADVEGAFLHAEMDDFVLLKIVAPEHIKIMCDINPENKKYVIKENGKDVLYLQLLRALYGCIRSALLWYDLFAGTLQKMGFVLNPIDRCVANKTINGKQCTILWYVDDNKISHIDPNVVTSIIEAIESHFGKMSVTRGRTHTFLGMDIDFIGDKKVKISMKNQVAEAIESFHEPIKRIAATPARNDLFDVDVSSKLLTENDADKFHSIVALLLYISIRVRADVLVAVAFLCTRVQRPTSQDKAKLQRVLEYLNGTRDLEYTIGADSIKRLLIWIDAAFAVHADMKGHTGGTMSMGWGSFGNKSAKQKLNTLSSTESEHVGTAFYLPTCIHLGQFLKYQGITLEEKVLNKDNMSEIKFLRNGTKSAGKNSRHVDIKLFFSKDRIDKENITLKHCPTDQMLADFFTKPLQGSIFRKFRDVVLGYKHISSLSQDAMTPCEERVGKKVNFTQDDIAGKNDAKRSYLEVALTKNKTE